MTTTPSKQQEKELPEIMQPVSVDIRFRDILLELIMDVVNGTLAITKAKHKLHAFIDSLSQEEKFILRQSTQMATISKRIRDIADTLTAETPSLQAKMQDLDL